MLILISCLLLFVTALTLIILRVLQPTARYTWLVAASGGILSLLSVFLWLTQMPFEFVLPAWQPVSLFATPILFRADEISWPFSISIAALTLATVLTASARPVFVNDFAWMGALALGGVGILAVTADNPLTLLLVWAFLDLTELLTQLRSVDGKANNEKVVISFSTRAFGLALLLWANIVSAGEGSTVNFQSMSASSGLFLVAAAGLRLGVFPLHLPYSSESTLRRGFGTSLRLISAASSMVVLAHTPVESLNSIITPFLITLALIASVYGGWMWLRAPDELNGRPYWIISLVSLSMVSALSGNPTGVIAWGCALILVGGALFLTSVQITWLNRVMLISVWSLSTLPFSLTASAWLGRLGIFTPFVIATQALTVAGFIRHVVRPPERELLDTQPGWARAVYPTGIFLLIIMQVTLGLIGWNGALQVGAWLQALIASLLTFGLVWATPRFRILNPIRAHWVTSTASRLNGIYQGFWTLYRVLARLSQAIIVTLEGEGGIMWTLLFLALFVSILTQGSP
ncbi:MAG: hypothetical protein JNM02_00065 [Anaerolineales bacterium]|nr:hypothetical protein [Anaerolineales bacterium]